MATFKTDTYTVEFDKKRKKWCHKPNNGKWALFQTWTLHDACTAGHLDEVKRMLTKDNLNSLNRDNRTPLYNAAANYKSCVVEYLLSQDGIDTSILNEYNQNILNTFSILPLGILKMILNHPTCTRKVINQRCGPNQHLEAPLDMYKVGSEQYTLLRMYGAKTSQELYYEDPAYDGKHVIEGLIEEGKYLNRYLIVCKNSINTNDRLNADNQTALHIATKLERFNELMMLLKKNHQYIKIADITLQDKYGNNMVHYLSQCNTVGVDMEFILNEICYSHPGALTTCLTMKNKKGETPIELAKDPEPFQSYKTCDNQSYKQDFFFDRVNKVNKKRERSSDQGQAPKHKKRRKVVSN